MSTYLPTLPPSAMICSSISTQAWLAPPCSGPHRALMPAEIEANRFASLEPTMPHGGRAAILLVIGMYDQQQIEGFDEVGVDFVLCRRHREHHVQEVFAVRQLVLGIHERLSDRFFVRVRSDRRQLGQQAVHGDFDLLRDRAD